MLQRALEVCSFSDLVVLGNMMLFCFLYECAIFSKILTCSCRLTLIIDTVEKYEKMCLQLWLQCSCKEFQNFYNVNRNLNQCFASI